MIDREIAIALIAGAIGIVGAIVGALVQHFLSLRAERIKTEWEREERGRERLRKDLLNGIKPEEVKVISPLPPKEVFRETKDGTRVVTVGRDLVIAEEEEEEE